MGRSVLRLKVAGDAEHRRFLLQSAAVGKNHPCMHVQMQKIEVAQRLRQPDVANMRTFRKIAGKTNSCAILRVRG